MKSVEFTFLDYSFFAIVLIVSTTIGLYYAVKTRKKATTADEYLLGGRKMGLFPVSCSLIATCISGVLLVGLTAETYAHGTHVWMYSFNVAVMSTCVSWIFLPVFAELKLTSSFMYLEMRFNRQVRQLASGLFLLTGLILLPITIYVPAMTFQSVTGINTYVTVVVLSVFCAAYTALGGFRAVVWTDVFQLCLMIVSYVTVVVIGINTVGGVSNVIEAGKRGGRIVFVNTENLNTRSSIVSYLFSCSIIMTYQYGISQTNLQRYLSLPSLSKMRILAWIMTAAFSLFFFLSLLLGLVMYANYETCDPFTAGFIRKIDQILPYFIQERASLFLGFNGIFIAGIFAASLSTTSSLLNALSGIIYEDFVRNCFPSVKDRSVGLILKVTTFALGIGQIFLVLIVEKMGMVLKMNIQVISISNSMLMTLFILGILIPNANSKGAQVGAISAMLSLVVLTVGSLNNKHEPPLPLRVDGCQNTTLSFVGTPKDGSGDIFWLFRINFTYYALIGTSVGITMGYLVSLFTGGNTVRDQRLLAVFLRRKGNQEEEMTLRPRKLQTITE